MVERGFGHVLNLASIGAYQPSPLYASYSAAKSFVLNFTEALSYELRGTGVHATALSPGWWPPSSSRSPPRRPPATSGAAGWTARRSPASAWTPCSGGRPTLVAGRRNAAAAWSVRLLPRRTAAALAHRAMR